MPFVRSLWIKLRTSFWFVPGSMVVVSLFLALLLIELDSRLKRDALADYPRVFGLGADGSRGMLTAIASSMLTVAALVFSLTLTIIAQASSQYTPRILRNFMRDRINQFILGYFVSAFAFCLIVLRTIRGGTEEFIPSMAVMVGLLLAIGGIAVLILFVHHITASLQVTTIVKNIVDETHQAIEKIFPDEVGEGADFSDYQESSGEYTDLKWVRIPSRKAGYIQTIETEEIIRYAQEKDFIMKLEKRIGDFVAHGEVIAAVGFEPGQKSRADDELEKQVNRLFTIDRYRTIEQDVGYGIRQIVDIALKALSPGINDTTTAVICIDYLRELVGEIARRRIPTSFRTDEDDRLRVIAAAPNFTDYVETAFDQIRINGKENFAIFLNLLQALSFVAGCTRQPNRVGVLQKQIELVVEFAEQTLQTNYEREKVRQKAADVRQIIFVTENT